MEVVDGKGGANAVLGSCQAFSLEKSVVDEVLYPNPW